VIYPTPRLESSSCDCQGFVLWRSGDEVDLLCWPILDQAPRQGYCAAPAAEETVGRTALRGLVVDVRTVRWVESRLGRTSVMRCECYEVDVDVLVDGIECVGRLPNRAELQLHLTDCDSR
jgi:hypothetical protein